MDPPQRDRSDRNGADGHPPPPTGADAPVNGADRVFVRRVLIVLGLVSLAGIFWMSRDALILLFGAILFAIVLRGLAGLLRRLVPIPDKASVGIVLVALVLMLGGFGLLFGTQISQQFSRVAEKVPDSLSRLEQTLGDTGWGRELLEAMRDLPLVGSSALAPEPQPEPEPETRAGAEQREPATGADATAGTGQPGQIATDTGGLGWLVRQTGQVLLGTVGAGADILLMLFGAIFLAFEPGLYRAGLEKLLPRDRVPPVHTALDRTGHALWLWAAGTLVEMTVVGVLTGLGLWALGVPAPLALGIIAGLLEFIPYIGPILSAIPAILLAFTESPTLALWTLGFYIVLQQVEGNLLLPLIQREAVNLPPVIAIFAILVFASLFGVTGIVFAVPLAVATMTLVQVLYVRQTLGRNVPVAGTQ